MKTWRIALVTCVCVGFISCVSSEKSREGGERKMEFKNASQDRKQEMVRNIAQKFLSTKLKKEAYQQYENAEYGVTYENSGITQKVRNVCEDGNLGCEIKWDTYEIKEPLWEVSISSCKSDDCLGGYFLIYIDDATGEVVYYGGYK